MFEEQQQQPQQQHHQAAAFTRSNATTANNQPNTDIERHERHVAMVNSNDAMVNSNGNEAIFAEQSFPFSSLENQFYERFDGANGWIDGWNRGAGSNRTGLSMGKIQSQLNCR